MKLLTPFFDYYENAEAPYDQIELDVIGICCDWTEYDISSIIEDYKYLVDLEDNEDNESYACSIAEKLRSHTEIIYVGASMWLVQNF